MFSSHKHSQWTTTQEIALIHSNCKLLELCRKLEEENQWSIWSQRKMICWTLMCSSYLCLRLFINYVWRAENSKILATIYFWSPRSKYKRIVGPDFSTLLSYVGHLCLKIGLLAWPSFFLTLDVNHFLGPKALWFSTLVISEVPVMNVNPDNGCHELYEDQCTERWQVLWDFFYREGF